MKFKIISLVLLLLSLLLLSSCGETNQGTDIDLNLGNLFSYSEGLEYEVNPSFPTQCTITGIGTCQDKVIKIPATIDGKVVTAVAPNAFATGQAVEYQPKMARSARASVITEEDEVLLDIEGVIFPYTVKEIGEEAFLGCENLESISASQGITNIGKDAFKDTAYYNNESNWENHALYIQSYLITVDSDYTGEFIIKEGTTTIADQAFYQCVNITGVTISSTVTSVGSYTFYGCANLTYVTNIGSVTFDSSSFEGCLSYKEYYFPGLGGNQGNEEPKEEHTSGYNKVTSSEFEEAKKMHPEFLAVTRINETELVITYQISTDGFYYKVEDHGETIKELRGVNDENGTNVFMRKDDKWYWSTAEVPEFEYGIPEDLIYDMLVIEDSKTLLYTYYMEEGSATSRIEIGFKKDKLEYIGFITPEYEIKTVFSEYGFTVLPEFNPAELSQDFILDENGNPV